MDVAMKNPKLLNLVVEASGGEENTVTKEAQETGASHLHLQGSMNPEMQGEYCKCCGRSHSTIQRTRNYFGLKNRDKYLTSTMLTPT
jgi:hypothetical protein